jgi:hypothetical protein
MIEVSMLPFFDLRVSSLNAGAATRAAVLPKKTSSTFDIETSS